MTVNYHRRKVLIDCGLFHGLKELSLRNREPFPIDPQKIDSVILTHAHLDHTGYLPVLMKQSFRGVAFAFSGSAEDHLYHTWRTAGSKSPQGKNRGLSPLELQNPRIS